MADVFELELHDIHEDDPNRAPDSDDDIIEVDEVIDIFFIIKHSFPIEYVSKHTLTHSMKQTHGKFVSILFKG